MLKHSLGPTMAFAAVLAFSFSALAQHGSGHPAGAGGSGGMGASSATGGNGGRPSDVGMSGMGHTSMGSQSPRSALSNPKLDTSLTKALGKSGITIPGGNLQTACVGFKNLGQCVAALHVSRNLGLSFSDLQGKMTGSNSESLGKAIEGLGGPNVNAKSEAKKANKQANEDLNAVDSTS